MRLGKSPPAKVQPMKIELDSRKRPVRVKSRKYTANQRKFLKAYVDKLVEIEPLFSKLMSNMRAWLEDSNFHDSNEAELLSLLEAYFTHSKKRILF